MDQQYIPKNYRLLSDINGRKRTIEGTFSPGEVFFEYKENETKSRRGLLLGDQYIVLDSKYLSSFHFPCPTDRFQQEGKSTI